MLINHSDSYGVIHPGDAAALAGRLEELCAEKTDLQQAVEPANPFDEVLLRLWAGIDSTFRAVSAEVDVTVTQQFIEGLRTAAAANETLVFN